MHVICPDYGKVIEVNGLGRKRLDMPVKNIYDSLRLHRSVQAAAQELGCSRGYIYKVLKSSGLTPAEIIMGLAAKDNSLLGGGLKT